MFVGRSSTSFSMVKFSALLCCTFLIVVDIENVTCMSLDRLAIDLNEIENEKPQQQEQEDYSANSHIIVDDMELEAIPAIGADIAGDTEMFVLLPADSVSEVESVDRNTIEESLSAVAEEESSSNFVENGSDMLMVETNDTPAAMQAIVMPVAVVTDANEMESEADKLNESVPAQEVLTDAVKTSDEMAAPQEVVKNDNKLSETLTDKVEEIAIGSELENANIPESTHEETNAPLEAQVETVEATDEDPAKKTDAESESVNDIIVDAVEAVEKEIESELVIDEGLKTEANNNVETNNDNIPEVSMIESVANDKDSEKLSEEDEEKQDTEVESVTKAYKETKSDIIESLTAAIDTMLPEKTADNEIKKETITSQKEIQDENLQHAEMSEAEITPEEAQAESEMEKVKDEIMSDEKLELEPQNDVEKELTDTVYINQETEINEEKIEEQAYQQSETEQKVFNEKQTEEQTNQQSETEQIVVKEEKTEEQVNQQTDIEQMIDEEKTEGQVNEQSETEQMVNEDKTDEQANRLSDAEQMVSNEKTEGQENQEIESEEMVNEEKPKEHANKEESNIETVAQHEQVQEELQMVDEKQEENEVTEENHDEIMQNQNKKKEDTIDAVTIEEGPTVETEAKEKVEEVSNTQNQEQQEQEPEAETQEIEVQNISKEEAHDTEINHVEQSQDIHQTEFQEEQKQEMRDEMKPDEDITSVQTDNKIQIMPEIISDDKQDDLLISEVEQIEKIISTPESAELTQETNKVIVENIIPIVENGDAPQTDKLVDLDPTTENKTQQITLIGDTVAPAIIAPLQEITQTESQNNDESESAVINEDKQQTILMDDTAAPENVISAQKENEEEPPKPEQAESTSILTTIIHIPQEPQMQTQEAAEEPTNTNENEAAAIAPASQQIPQETTATAAMIESTTQKPLNVVDSVLNYVNASLMQQNNNKPLQDDELFNSKLRRYDGAQVWRIVVQNDKDKKLADELQTKYDGQLWKEVKQEVDYLLKPQILADAEKHVRAANLSRIVLIDNLQKVIEVENPPADQIALLQNRKGHRLSWQAYHRLADIHDFFDYLAKTYPDICAVETIGYSIQKRPLKILKISNGNAGNPGIWIDGGMHAREWISPASVTYIANEIVEGWDDLPAYMKNVNWYIHAVANPDGYEYTHTTDRLWRKNMRAHGRQCPGVDLNRNFGYKWGGKGTSANPCSQTYRGSKAFSEPETFYISKFISNFPRETFQAYLSFHSYGQYILYPWGYDYQLTKDRADLDRVARQAGTTITKGSGVKYTVGSSATTLYPAAGGSDDWAKGIAGIKYAYTIELGDTGRYGFVLPASFIEFNGKDSFTFVETVARAVTMGKESRKRAF